MNIAILPIKSDSRRIPMKLFKDFCGKPLHVWVATEVFNCAMIDKVYVSTPDKWFKKIISPTFEFIDRPKELAGDVELTEVMKHAAKQVAKSGDNIIQIQLNKPLTKLADIMQCIKAFTDGNFDSLSTVQPIGTKVINGTGTMKSQAICKIWKYDTLINTEITIENPYAYGERHFNLPIAKHHIEIDDIEDWRIAEALKKAGF